MGKLMVVAARFFLLCSVLLALPAIAAPSVTLDPTSGPVNTQVTATGSGFTAGNKVVDVFWDNTYLTEARTDNLGNFSVSFNVPQDAAVGDHQAFSNGYGQASAIFTVTTAIPPKCTPLGDGKSTKHCYVTAEQRPSVNVQIVGGLFTEPTPGDQLTAWPWSSKYSIGQLALASEQEGNAIEFGEVVIPEIYFDFKPHLFIAIRSQGKLCVFGEPGASNDCPSDEYVQVSQNKKPGDPVGDTGHAMMYAVGYYGENACGGEKGWWIQYGDEYIGCVKESWFGDNGFASGNVVQWFGELAYDTDACVPMGNGKFGKTDPNAASISNMFYGTVNGLVSAQAYLRGETDSRYWNSDKTPQDRFDTFHYGGPGLCGSAR